MKVNNRFVIGLYILDNLRLININIYERRLNIN
jgi:hypothetical protein